MVEAQDHDGEQNTVTLTDMPFFPATVVGHRERRDGMTLITMGDDGDTNIETYDDDRDCHRSGNPPTEE